MSVAAPSASPSPASPPPRPRSPSRCRSPNLLRRRLRGVKNQPGVPGAFQVLFFGPALRFEIAEIGGRTCALAEMARGHERVVDPAALHLRAIKLVADAVIVGGCAESTFQLLERSAGSNARQGDRLAVTLRQFVRGAKIIFTGVVFGDTEPG